MPYFPHAPTHGPRRRRHGDWRRQGRTGQFGTGRWTDSGAWWRQWRPGSRIRDRIWDSLTCACLFPGSLPSSHSPTCVSLYMYVLWPPRHSPCACLLCLCCALLPHPFLLIPHAIACLAGSCFTTHLPNHNNTLPFSAPCRRAATTLCLSPPCCLPSTPTYFYHLWQAGWLFAWQAGFTWDWFFTAFPTAPYFSHTDSSLHLLNLSMPAAAHSPQCLINLHCHLRRVDSQASMNPLSPL